MSFRIRLLVKLPWMPGHISHVAKQAVKKAVELGHDVSFMFNGIRLCATPNWHDDEEQAKFITGCYFLKQQFVREDMGLT